MLKTIVVGFDGSDASHDALVLGERIAAVSDARLIAAYVYAVDPLVRPSAQLEHELRADAERHLHAAVEAIRSPGPELRVIPSHSTIEGLSRLAEREPVDLIVVGSSRLDPLGLLSDRGTAERLLQGAPCAVAVAPSGYARSAPAQLRTIGIGYNATPESDAALKTAAELARAAGARLLVTMILGAHVSIVTPRAVATLEVQAYALQGRAEEERRLRTAVAALHDVDAVAIPEDGEPVAALTARSHELHLLVLGSRRFGPLRRTLLGSVSAPLLTRAACPVLIAPRAAREEASPA